MKTGLLKRVERIEQRVNPGENVEAIFIRIVSPSNPDRPVRGWSFTTDGNQQVEVLRKKSETDEELKKRAEGLARKHLGRGFLILNSINDQTVKPQEK